MSLQIAVLLTCHNRKQKTVRCLQSLLQQQCDGFDFEIFLVDDGSTDGTTAAVQQLAGPITIIAGNGQLYWNGGMRLAWQAALSSPVDYYLWLNDDVELYPLALQNLLGTAQTLAQQYPLGAVVGTMQDKPGGKPTYGGRCIPYPWLPLMLQPVLAPTDAIQRCDYVNGNLCLISAAAVKDIGILSDRYTHSMGDFDYSVRLRKAGFALFVAPGFVGVCQKNPLRGSIFDDDIPIRQRLAMMQNPVFCPPINEWLWFLRQHAGPFWFLFWAKAWLGRKLPRLWLWLNRRKKHAGHYDGRHHG